MSWRKKNIFQSNNTINKRIKARKSNVALENSKTVFIEKTVSILYLNSLKINK